MNFQLTDPQKRAIYFVESVTLANVDNDSFREWPELMTRSQAARFLGVTPKHISVLSGEHLQKQGTRWRLGDLQAYAQKREKERARDELGRFVKF